METFISDLSGKEFPVSEKIPSSTIRPSLLKLVRKDKPDFPHKGFISLTELNQYRERYITEYLTREIGELTKLEQTVIDSMTTNSTITDKLDIDNQKNLSIGERIADRVATFGGSWTFIISFLLFILLWISINVFWLYSKAFDPYPFILLNLILSCIAALQAPVIMMSQNRQEDKDRERAKNDYMVNLKSELEIRTLHEKVDHFIIHQQQELFEIQKVQVDMMNEILGKFH